MVKIFIERKMKTVIKVVIVLGITFINVSCGNPENEQKRINEINDSIRKKKSADSLDAILNNIEKVGQDSLYRLERIIKLVNSGMSEKEATRFVDSTDAELGK